ncbi:MAG: hypothetical protein IPK19_35575 [Chloroflexi bacterium]|nr:hypothetical protein [Chloroflexota bacterium]
MIAKYVTIDDHNVDIGLQSRDRLNLLVAEVPFVKPIDAPPEMDENDDLPDQPEAGDAKNSSAKAG